MTYSERCIEGEVIDLLRQLIANSCVNDGTPSSGQEVRNVELLADYLDVPGLEMESFEPYPGRRSLLVRLGHSDRAASRSRKEVPSLLLMGHTDVVPVEEDLWRRDPFGGEVVDGWVWGRGAVDMLNLTASMAVALRTLAVETRWRTLSGDLLFLAVADEEASGVYGARWLTENHPKLFGVDAMITESGGVPIPTGSGVRLPVIVAEKGTHWCRLTVHGTPGHASRPFGTDNALAKAATVVGRLSEHRPAAMIPEAWKIFVEGLELGDDLTSALTDPNAVDAACEGLPLALAREAYSGTHTTFTPTVCHAGEKTNVIPGTAIIDVDIRTVPGQSSDQVSAMLINALGDLASSVDIEPLDVHEATCSPTGTPIWNCLNRVAQRFYQGSSTLPMLSVGATDARFFRSLGVPSYGFGMFSRKMSIEEFSAMFHGNDERVDVDSLTLSTQMWSAVGRDYLA